MMGSGGSSGEEDHGGRDTGGGSGDRVVDRWGPTMIELTECADM